MTHGSATRARGLGPAAGAVPLTPPPSARRIAAWAYPVVFAGLGLLAVQHVGIGLAALAEGGDAMGALLARAWTPTLAAPATTFAHVLDTLSMTIAGTALAVAAAAVLAVLAARNTTPGPAVRSLALAMIVGCRVIPDMVFAIFFVAALGIGPLPGVLALGLHSIGMLGKLFTEAVEAADDGIGEAVAATGAGPVRRLLAGIFPQAVPSMVAVTLYRIDINFRASVLLGAVGAGGIGMDLRTAFGFTDYREALGISCVVVAVVFLVEAVALGLRSLLIGGGRASGLPPVRGTRVPWTAGRTVTHVAAWGGLLVAAVACWRSGATPDAAPATAAGSLRALTEFFPPDFAPVLDMLGPGLAEVCAIAMAATFLGVLGGLVLGLLAARTVAPHPAVRAVARAALAFLRSIPDLLLVLLFVAAFGIAEGAVAGTCALSLFTASFVGKLVADTAEEIRPGPKEAILSTGAGRVQELLYTVLGQLTPRLAGHSLYALDVNLRSFLVLGIVGAGEIGFALSRHIRSLDYDVVTAIVLPIFAIVLVVELVSASLRGALR
ncbi:phosphonate ABC transporter, permease protein PhnE [Spongiactinospora gelatinilytica]|uniref:Phosphonate ABC transporter, permease protein PhnE n=1 Tax=Spongiactinospora gelatinilytica TaxID=2666298 RepID=A0A2W2HIK1_9ACTN|nr:phosphonate ABC transporter, permease protein PhnE [Spongiactinospora gelatinilytica]PZG51495.1 phosphonate ABC transporter, permease protein PhnE [Spongiactinospora gelatinilytica]